MITSIISTYVSNYIYKYKYNKEYCKDGTHTIENKDDIIKINGKCYDINTILTSIKEDLNKIDPLYPRIKDIADSAIPIHKNLNKKTLKKIHKYIKDKAIEKPVDLFFKNLDIFINENTQEIKKLFVNNDLQYSFKNNKWEELSDSNINDFIDDITRFINNFDNTKIKPNTTFEDNINGVKNKNYNNDIYYKNIISDNDIYEKQRLNKLKIYILANKKPELNKPVEVFLNNIYSLNLTPRGNFKKNINEIFKTNNIVYNNNNKWN